MTDNWHLRPVRPFARLGRAGHGPRGGRARRVGAWAAVGATLLVEAFWLMGMFPAGRTATAGTVGVTQSFGAQNTSGSATLSASPGAATTAGDLLVAVIRDRNPNVLAPVTNVTDTAGNPWVLATSVTRGTRVDEEIWYAANAASVAASQAVTVTVGGTSASTSAIAFTVLDVTGASPSPLDVTATMSGNTQPALTGTTTTAQPGEIAIAGIGWNGYSAAAGQTAGYTVLPTQQSPVRGSTAGEQAAWQFLSATGAQSYAATLSSPNAAWTGAIATFKVGGTSATPTPTLTPTPTTTPTATPTATPTPTPTPPPPANAPHVMVVMLENRGYAATLGSCSSDPYFCSLAAQNVSATSWFGIAHPSLPNYLAVVSGSTQGCTSDSCFASLPGPDLGGQLSAAGVPWTAYMESMPSPCFTGRWAPAGSTGSNALYAEKHDPFVIFSDVLTNGCAGRVLPYPGASSMVATLDGASPPDFVWITPNQQDNMHNGTVQSGDAWLQANLDPVFASSWFTTGNATVIVTMDEASGSSSGCCGDAAGGQIPLVVISNAAKGKGPMTTSGDHYGTLRSIEEAYGLPLLGAAAQPGNGDFSALIPPR